MLKITKKPRLNLKILRFFIIPTILVLNPFCIRIMAQVLLPPNYEIKHPYLKGAAKLRADRC